MRRRNVAEGEILEAPAPRIVQTGDVNAARFKKNGVEIGDLVSFAWTAGISPHGVILLTNSSGRNLTLRYVYGSIEVNNTSNATVELYYAANGVTISNGTRVPNSSTFYLQSSEGVYQSLLLNDFTVAPGVKIGLRLTFGVNATSVATITAFMV